jgi:prepilin signal peptidase PulO-like enzyme (type II secretory pathway)
MPFILNAGLLFIASLLLASFFNVILYRHRQKKSSWWQGRSYCEQCQHQLAWYDNIPLLSYFLLQGQCRYCQAEIDQRHPKLELLTACALTSLGLLIHVFAQPSLHILYSLVAAITWLIVLFDWQYLIIPDSLVSLLLALALPWRVGQWWWGLISNQQLLLIFTSTLLFSVFFLSLWWFTQQRGFGLGDVKLMIPLGLLAGFPQVVLTVFLAFIIGGIFGIILLITGRKGWKQKIAFGPFLISGFWLSVFCGARIWQWYQQLLF